MVLGRISNDTVVRAYEEVLRREDRSCPSPRETQPPRLAHIISTANVTSPISRVRVTHAIRSEERTSTKSQRTAKSGEAPRPRTHRCRRYHPRYPGGEIRGYGSRLAQVRSESASARVTSGPIRLATTRRAGRIRRTPLGVPSRYSTAHHAAVRARVAERCGRSARSSHHGECPGAIVHVHERAAGVSFRRAAPSSPTRASRRRNSRSARDA